MTTLDPTAPTSAHLWRSDLLGASRQIHVAGGDVEYFERGEGPVLVFAHGWLANANLWRDVVDRLADRFRCVTLDLPLGAHRLPMDAGADLSPTGCGEIIAEFIAKLNLNDVTLVGNDSGGAYSQIAAATYPDRVARLVLNSCETPYDAFPPPPFDGLPAIAADSSALGELFEALRDRAVRATPPAYGLLIKHPIDDHVSDSYALPSITNPGILHDASKVMSTASSDPVHEAGNALIDAFDGPVLFVWGSEDQVFPLENAKRFADGLENSQVFLIADAYSFTPEDQPGEIANAIAQFCDTGLPESPPGPRARREDVKA
jgi:pimeloyl-ACP methyl ester carboxylesterase